MKRTVLIVVSVVLVAAIAVWLLQRGGVDSQGSDDAELAVEGRFLSDSLGVGLLLPQSAGWSFERPAPVSGAPYVIVLHESGNASLKLYVNDKSQLGGEGGEETGELQKVIQRRRDQLAAGFRAKDLDNVVEQVLVEAERDFDGFPSWQWQALTEPVDIAGEEPANVMFLIQIIERQSHIFELVGLAKMPLRPSPQEKAANTALLGDLGFILESVQAR